MRSHSYDTIWDRRDGKSRPTSWGKFLYPGPGDQPSLWLTEIRMDQNSWVKNSMSRRERYTRDHELSGYLLGIAVNGKPALPLRLLQSEGFPTQLPNIYRSDNISFSPFLWRQFNNILIPFVWIRWIQNVASPLPILWSLLPRSFMSWIITIT